MIDWLWSTAFHTATLVALAGALGVIRPLRWLHRASRRRAALMLLAGTAGVVPLAVMTPSSASAATPSWILRATWLDAIKTRAEKATS